MKKVAVAPRRMRERSCTRGEGVRFGLGVRLGVRVRVSAMASI